MCARSLCMVLMALWAIFGLAACQHSAAQMETAFRCSGSWFIPPSFHGNAWSQGGDGTHLHFVYEPLFLYQAADRQVDAPDQIRFPTHARSELLSQCAHLNLADSLTQPLMNALPEAYTYAQLRQAVDEHRHHTSSAEQHHQLHQLLESVEEVYELQFSSDTTLSERVIFPVLEHERNGIEDARFVLFKDDDGQHTYYGTYTAYDGLRIQPRLLETTDFRSFRSFALNGPGAVNKNLALLPRRIKGRYAMLSRLDGVNNFIAFSE